MVKSYSSTINAHRFTLEGYAFEVKHTGMANTTVGFDAFVWKPDGTPLTRIVPGNPLAMRENARFDRDIQIRGHLSYAGLNERNVSFNGVGFVRGIRISPKNNVENDDERTFFENPLLFVQREKGYDYGLRLSDDTHKSLSAFIHAEYRRILHEVIEAVESLMPIDGKIWDLWRIHIGSEVGLEADQPYKLSPAELVHQYRARTMERQQRQVKWDALFDAGKTVVAAKRCWECGRIVIDGMYTRDKHLVRMPKDLWQKAMDDLSAGVKRSTESVAPGTIISSVGFQPAESQFEWWISSEDYYCGC